MKPMRKCRALADAIDLAMLLGAAARVVARRQAEVANDTELATHRPLYTFAVGDVVVLTGKAFYAMGYGLIGPESLLLSRWTVIECACALCQRGNHVCVNEPIDPADLGYEGFRHFATMQLRLRGQPSTDDCGPCPPQKLRERRPA